MILVKYGCDGAVPVQRTFRIRLVDYTIFAAVQRNIVLFSRCDCRGKVCLEEGCLYILNAFVEKSLDILLVECSGMTAVCCQIIRILDVEIPWHSLCPGCCLVGKDDRLIAVEIVHDPGVCRRIQKGNAVCAVVMNAADQNVVFLCHGTNGSNCICGDAVP